MMSVDVGAKSGEKLCVDRSLQRIGANGLTRFLKINVDGYYPRDIQFSVCHLYFRVSNLYRLTFIG